MCFCIKGENRVVDAMDVFCFDIFFESVWCITFLFCPRNSNFCRFVFVYHKRNNPLRFNSRKFVCFDNIAGSAERTANGNFLMLQNLFRSTALTLINFCLFPNFSFIDKLRQVSFIHICIFFNIQKCSTIKTSHFLNFWVKNHFAFAVWTLENGAVDFLVAVKLFFFCHYFNFLPHSGQNFVVSLTSVPQSGQVNFNFCPHSGQNFGFPCSGA